MIWPSARRALLTELVSGKTSATSGSRTTMIVPLANRPAYFPRTPPEKSYSGSMSSESRLERTLLILFPFTAGCRSRADDSNRLAKYRMYHDQGSISIGPPNGHEPTLLGRMKRVADGNGERSRNTEAASTKATPCFRAFERAFSGSQRRTDVISRLIFPFTLRVNSEVYRPAWYETCSALTQLTSGLSWGEEGPRHPLEREYQRRSNTCG